MLSVEDYMDANFPALNHSTLYLSALKRNIVA